MENQDFALWVGGEMTFKNVDENQLRALSRWWEDGGIFDLESSTITYKFSEPVAVTPKQLPNIVKIHDQAGEIHATLEGCGYVRTVLHLYPILEYEMSIKTGVWSDPILFAVSTQSE